MSVDEEELTKFWKTSASGSISKIFFKNSSTSLDRAFFHNLAHISGNTALDLHKNFIIEISLDKEVPVKFCKSPGSGLRVQTRFTLAEVCAL